MYDKERKLRKQRERHARTRAKLAEYKASRGCADCGEEDSRVLQFHHRGDKRFQISHYVGLAWDTLMREVAKCDILCANCHIKRHWPAGEP